jgi:hypothetical protein
MLNRLKFINDKRARAQRASLGAFASSKKPFQAPNWFGFFTKRSYDDCRAQGLSIAVVPMPDAGWSALISPKQRTTHPFCAKRVEAIQMQLREMCVLKGWRRRENDQRNPPALDDNRRWSSKKNGDFRRKSLGYRTSAKEDRVRSRAFRLRIPLKGLKVKRSGL